MQASSIPYPKYDLTQIVNGVAHGSPSPYLNHQRILRKFQYALDEFVTNNALGEVFSSPLDVIFEEGKNRFQPDVLFISQARMHIAQDWVRGAPDLVMEVVSTGSYRLDTEEKKTAYEHYGVLEYWLIIPQVKVVEVFALQEGRYQLHSIAEGEGRVQSRLLPSFGVDVATLFAQLGRTHPKA